MSSLPLFWKLLVEDIGDLQSWLEADPAKVEKPHITLLVLGGTAARNTFLAEEFEHAKRRLQCLDGSEVDVQAVTVFRHDDIIVVQVQLAADVPCASGVPHFILWHSEQVSRKRRTSLAIDMIEGREDCIMSTLCPPLSLRGVVCLESQSGESTTFIGKLLGVETHPRPSRQTEPQGHAWFVDADLAQAWTASLAASLRQEAAGPPDLRLKANVQSPGKPGHIYLKWGAAVADTTASELGRIIEERLRQLGMQIHAGSQSEAEIDKDKDEMESDFPEPQLQERPPDQDSAQQQACWSGAQLQDANPADLKLGGLREQHSPSLRDSNEQAPSNESQPDCSVSLLRFKNAEMLRNVVYTSILGANLVGQGLDIEPAWAKGAKVLFQTKASALPEEIISELRPYHVLVRSADKALVHQELQSLTYKQRPRHYEQKDQLLSLKFVVEKTFIHIPEQSSMSPRSAFTKSSNDLRHGYQNPRIWRCDLDSYTDAASSGLTFPNQRSFEGWLSELKRCQTHRDLPSAIQCYSSMVSKGLHPDAQMFTIIIDICAKTGNCEDSERWMQTMMEKGRTPNLITFNCVIHGYASLGNASKAEEWFEKLASAQLQPSLVTYNCLIKAHAKRGCIDEAEKWRMSAATMFDLNVHSYAPIIEHFSHKGLACKAEEWYDRMTNSGVAADRESYAMMVSAAANALDLERAWRWAERMRYGGHELRAYEYTQLLKACAPGDDDPADRKLHDKASAIFHEQILSGIRPNHLNLNALKNAVGYDCALTLCSGLSVDIAAAENEFNALRDELGVTGWMVRKVGEDGAIRRNCFEDQDYFQNEQACKA